MTFAQARDSEFPPYLLDFAGSPGERHVENLKVRLKVRHLYPMLLSIVFSRSFVRLAQPNLTKPFI